MADLGSGPTDIILMASGSEVTLAYKAAQALAAEGHAPRVVSIPSWELFEAQDQEYKDAVLVPGVKRRISVEAGVTTGWQKWVGDNGATIGIDHYGASAPIGRLMQEFGFMVEHILAKAHAMFD